MKILLNLSLKNSVVVFFLLTLAILLILTIIL